VRFSYVAHEVGEDLDVAYCILFTSIEKSLLLL